MGAVKHIALEYFLRPLERMGPRETSLAHLFVTMAGAVNISSYWRFTDLTSLPSVFFPYPVKLYKTCNTFM